MQTPPQERTARPQREVSWTTTVGRAVGPPIAARGVKSRPLFETERPAVGALSLRSSGGRKPALHARFSRAARAAFFFQFCRTSALVTPRIPTILTGWE